MNKKCKKRLSERPRGLDNKFKSKFPGKEATEEASKTTNAFLAGAKKAFAAELTSTGPAVIA